MNYSKTKFNRKKNKYSKILGRDFDVLICDEPTKNLVICNGGLVNGVDKEAVYQLLHKYGRICNLIMIPHKSYCLASFCSTEECREAVLEVNDMKVWPQIQGPLFLTFAEDFPEKVLNINKENFDTKPPGLIILKDFITVDEEELILSSIGNTSARSSMKHRIVKHYGYEFKYDNNNVNVDEPIEPIPNEIDFLWNLLSKCETVEDFNMQFIPDQLTVNVYEPGQGIPPHVDTHSPFCDVILSLSLQSDVVMTFKNTTGICCSVLLPARSLCIMSGESRYGWTHGITPRKSDLVPSSTGGLTLMRRGLRTSLTFRKTRQGKCSCSFPSLCDSQKEAKQVMSVEVQENNPGYIETLHVHQVYEKIAGHFSETRHKPWPNVAKFIMELKPWSVLVDIGCGNGKYLGLRKDCFEVGCDHSSSLMTVCQDRGFQCFTCNCLYVPLRDGVADACISIAVIHHLSTEKRRFQAIQEMVRLLKPGGRGLIYVWAMNQERQSEKSSYLKQGPAKGTDASAVTAASARLPVHVNRTNFQHADLLVPWKLKPGSDSEAAPNTYLRYYHVFVEEELRLMCLDVPGITIDKYYYDQGNWCVVFDKST